MESFEFKVDKDAPLLPTTEEYQSVLQLAERAYMEQIALFQEDLYNKGYGDGYRAAKAEIVRCKDCKYWETVEYYPDGTKDVCRLLKRQTQDDCFCSYGERRADAENH